MSKMIAAMSLLLLLVVGVFGIPLEPPQPSVLAEFGTGTGQGLLSFGPDDGYEPSWPTSISMTEAGELFILDYRQGIIKYDQSFRFLGSIDKVFHQFTVSENLVVAWNSESEAQELVTYGHRGPDLFPIASKLINGASKIEQVLIRDATIVTLHRDGSFLFWQLEASQKALVSVTPSESDLHSLNLTVKKGELQDTVFGFFDKSAETLFLTNNKQEQQYATTENGRDSVNISSGTILGIDQHGFRTVLSRKKRIAIVSQSGDLVRVFDLRKDLPTTSRTEAICTLRSGDVLFLESTSSGHKLMKIERTW